MGTIIENINALSKIKYDLKNVLVDNGQRGGEVFSEYPEQFRDLFRVLEDYVDHTNMGYSPQALYVQSIVPTPEMYYDENIVFIHCDMQQATIKYWIVTESGKNNQGETTLKGNTIMVTEACTVYCYALYRGEPSATAELFVPYYPEIVPDDPVITREGTTVTITCATTTATIYYKLNEGGEYQIYTGPITVPRTVDVYSFAQDYRGRSYEVKDEAPEKPVKPATPVLTFSNNTITIVCETTGASIYYMKEGGYWYEYTGPITITAADTGYYYTKSIKDYTESDISERVWCEYSEEPVVIVPADPVISCSNNVVTITCSTSGATIYYLTDNGVTYNEYTGTITISADTTFYAYSELNGETSNTVSYEAQYEDTPQPVAPADPVISCTNNIVTITCSTSGAVIWYSTDGGNTYNIYTEPISISADTTFYAYSANDGLTSNVVGPYEAEYITAPAQPVVSTSNNEITITCSTSGATIYYCIVTSIYGTRNYIQYNGPITFDASLYTPDTYVYLYTYSTKNNLDSSVYRDNILIPIPPVINNIYNEISITSTYSNYYGTIYYKINSEGTYTVYEKPFIINEACTIYAYVYTRWGVNSAVVEEIVEEISSVKYSPWITATYIKYDLPISKYNDFKGFYQLNNVKKSWGGSDNIRFVLNGEKLYIQLPNRTFIKDMKTSVTWTGLNAESHNTSTVIPSSSYSIRFGPGAPMWFWNMDPEQFTPGNTTDYIYNMSISSFVQGNVYVGDYSGTCTADFSVPKLNSRSDNTVYLSNMGQGFQKVITNYNQWSGGGDGQPIFNSEIRFEPLCKYTYSSTTKNEFPFRFNDITTRINGVQFYSSTHNKYLYNGIGIVLNTASNQNI